MNDIKGKKWASTDISMKKKIKGECGPTSKEYGRGQVVLNVSSHQTSLAKLFLGM